MNRSLPDSVRMVEYLREHRGVWMTGQRIKHGSKAETPPSLVLSSLVKEGVVERRGRGRGTMYRVV